MPQTHLEFMQSEASRNWDFHLQNMESLQREANITLTFLYVVISASFSGALKLFIGGDYNVLAISLSILCVYLSFLAIVLAIGCLLSRPVKAPSNEPKNLKIRDGLTSEQIQNHELANLQERIEFNIERNATTGRRLNFVRVMICLSPIFFLIVFSILTLIHLVCRGSS